LSLEQLSALIPRRSLLFLAQTLVGASRIEELQKQLFEAAGDVLRHDIERITGTPVVDTSAAVDRENGSVIRSFPSGTLVQIYLLASNVSPQHWSGTDPSDPEMPNSQSQESSENK
jgi:hypothetical protein